MTIPKIPTVSSIGDGSSVIQSWCQQHGFEYIGETGGEITIVSMKSSEPRFTYIAETSSVSDEIYELAIEARHVTITFGGLRALRYAMNAIGDMVKRQAWQDGVQYDYPRFALRGIIEGFYGQPWNQEQRLDMLQFIASRNMNTYIYGPKDDAYHRERWRDLYDPQSYERLTEVFSKACEVGLDFYYCIAPGLSMRYSSEEDYRILVRKVRQMFEMGVRHFGLLLDDIPEKLQHPEDIAAYPDLVAAHVHLVNRFFEEIKQWDASIRLVACPTQYWGKGNERYISKLGGGLHPSIDLFWTGRNICSQEITLMEAAVFTQNTYRKPLYWDNYPVNDMEMTDEMHIGPYQQRDPHLYRFSRGIIANAMEFAESSKISISTVASYLWDPLRYDAELSWREAIEEIAGSKDYLDVLRFADNVRYSCLYPTDSPTLAAALMRFDFDYFYGDRMKAIDELAVLVTEMNTVAEKLQSDHLDNKALQHELLRWIRKYAAGCELLQACIAYFRSGDIGVLEEIRIQYLTYRGDATYVFADVLVAFLNKVTENGFDNNKNMDLKGSEF